MDSDVDANSLPLRQQDSQGMKVREDEQEDRCTLHFLVKCVLNSGVI